MFLLDRRGVGRVGRCFESILLCLFCCMTYDVGVLLYDIVGLFIHYYMTDDGGHLTVGCSFWCLRNAVERK